MKLVKTLFILAVVAIAMPLSAQTADEIISTYIENTGGDAWNDVEATKMSATVNQGGMSIPVTVYNTKDGKQAVVIEFNGQKITQMAFDGETLWTTNFMSMKPEKASEEMSNNMKLNNNDFPSPLLHYKENGYEVEYVGTETKDGAETYKVKITQEPVMMNGVETPSISYYYFDQDSYVPIAIETTQMGQPINITMSDYQEVEGLYFPFAMSQAGQPFQMSEIVVNPEIDESIFEFPEE
ncbi:MULTISPECIES: outer membrane lipoprotein-sorting protein [unclassified Leeuwenhoekiella]|uniref:outer membrane lipoprotein-sorting protein n=1 Tax=unclassified Leeuwenhoekiella TaxID=2615029 RepID=UPI000C61E245|nr:MULTISPECIES: outer membrane lipoprotein-sorting protein [unclassified Leeuwenhoekiella]MAW93849.1 outer membrane lipoprotein-sorting protein [Leeuwenhoekiella sp.]MBA82256.1 outer membrane lipoprotein-sorting protein [Leeuwenhoekiella sp.]|tara:strand:- start:469 stop:1185 length:717 start_codon:yes stop_codon:yes gene_type:complete